MPVHLTPHPSYSLEFDSAEALLDEIKDEFQRIHSEVLEGVLKAGSFVSRSPLNTKVTLFLETK
jgi:hypothetical protein